jgi:hypothetical protein
MQGAQVPTPLEIFTAHIRKVFGLTLEFREWVVSQTTLFEISILAAVSITELAGNVTSAFALALGASDCEWKVHDWQAKSASQSMPP